MKKLTQLAQKIIYPFTRVINSIGVVFLMFIMLMVTVDVILRALFNSPLLGTLTYEAIGFMMVILVFFAAAYCQVQKGHITIDLFTSRIPKNARRTIKAIINLICAALFGVIAWQSITQADFLRETGTISKALPMPVFPFMYIVAFGSCLLALVLLVNFLEALTGESKR